MLAFCLRRYSACFVLYADVTSYLHYQALNFVMSFYKVVLSGSFIKVTF
jgi:hypothetical protein